MKRITTILMIAACALTVMAGQRGDLDNNGTIDVTDVNAAINIILKVKTVADYSGNGDMDGNSTIDVADVNHIINVILGMERPQWVDGSPIGVMEGDWRVKVDAIDDDGNSIQNDYGVIGLVNIVSTYANNNGDTDKMWFTDPGFWQTRYQMPINLSDHTFAATNVPYDEDNTGNVTIRGAVIPSGAISPYGLPIDSIWAVAQFDDDEMGYTWRYSGYRNQEIVALELLGDENIAIPLGTPYVDAGFTATLEGTDVSSRVSSESNVNINQIGVYHIRYTVLNDIWVLSEVTRTVAVYDPNDQDQIDITGYYVTDMEASNNGKGTFASYSAQYTHIIQCNGIVISQLCPGIYTVSDMTGGWYSQIRGYGTRYEMIGHITIDDAGNVTLLDSHVAGWNNGLDYIENAKYDADTATISFDLSYLNAVFLHVVMYKIEDL